MTTHFLETTSRRLGVSPRRVAPDALTELLRYTWPGNVRELEHLMERLVVLTDATITLDDMPRYVRRGGAPLPHIEQRVLAGQATIGDAVAELERTIIIDALGRCDFDLTRTAELGTNRRVLRYRIDQPGIEVAR